MTTGVSISSEAAAAIKEFKKLDVKRRFLTFIINDGKLEIEHEGDAHPVAHRAEFNEFVKILPEEDWYGTRSSMFIILITLDTLETLVTLDTLSPLYTLYCPLIVVVSQSIKWTLPTRWGASYRSLS